MSFNLADAAKAIITKELVSKASGFLGESESGVSKAFTGIIPGILSGLIHKSSSPDGANLISKLASEQYSEGILNNPGIFSGSDGTSWLSKTTDIISSLFGSKADSITQAIAGFSGIKSSSAGSLLSIATPILLGFLGKHAADNNLSSGGLASLLKTQKFNVLESIPGGLNLGGIFNEVPPSVASARHPMQNAANNSGGGLKKLLPILLLALAAAAAFYFFRNGCGEAKEPITIITDSVTSKIEQAVNKVAGKVDSLSGDFIYEPGNMVTIDLPNAAGKLSVGENSTEYRLCKFLADPAAVIDTVKGNWFEFTNVRFKTGGTQLDSTSEVQLKNLVAISKGYPSAQFKLGGYTDNTGDSVANVMLSQKRAEAVMGVIKKLGINASAITTAKGYGPMFPIGDNTTAEGRAMNRRVALNVKAK